MPNSRLEYVETFFTPAVNKGADNLFEAFHCFGIKKSLRVKLKCIIPQVLNNLFRENTVLNNCLPNLLQTNLFIACDGSEQLLLHKSIDFNSQS